MLDINNMSNNKTIYSNFLKAARLWDFLVMSGRAFHATAPLYLKLRFRKLVLDFKYLINYL